MKITAKWTGKRVDVRDTCSDLHLKASTMRSSDEFMLTRLYRYFTELESDEDTAMAINLLRLPTKRLTSHGADVVMTKREGSTS